MSRTNPKVMIVDDEQLLRELLVEEFALAGFDVQEASNGRDAFKLIATGGFAAVVSDVRMPGGDGLELLDSVMKMTEVKPLVFMITGFADISEPAVIQRGAQRLFSKPMSLEEMTLAVHAALKRTA